MRKNIFLYLILFVGLMWTCKNGRDQQSNNADYGKKIELETDQENEGKAMESISAAKMQDVWKKADYMDLIMYNSPVSVSQDEQGAVRASLRYISEKPAIVPSNCKPEGRLSYMADGIIELEADIYFSDNCQLFVFMEDGKPRFANHMTPDGINFFNQVVQAMPPTQ